MDLLAILDRTRFFLKFGIFALIWGLESLRPMYAQKEGRYRHAGRNIGIAVVNVALLGFFVATVTARVCEWASLHRYGLLHQFDAPDGVKGILALLMIDGWLYLWHRLNHRIPFLWRFHRMHHTDLALDVTSASRFHPGELFFSALLRTGLVPLFGLQLWHVLLYELLLMPIIQFHHSNVSIQEKWDRKLRLLIVSPHMHWVHHSDFRRETDSNYASIFSFWDRLFGSYTFRPDLENLRYGVYDPRARPLQSLPDMLKTPLA